MCEPYIVLGRRRDREIGAFYMCRRCGHEWAIGWDRRLVARATRRSDKAERGVGRCKRSP
ncbi:MAG: hypothetical protein H5T97_09585 [Firmicutes bacterium]|nr:hypothetical protein [Bacillota bacterium]